MAIPERDDPKLRRQEVITNEPVRPVRRGGGGWWWAWIIIVALVIWWAGWGWGGSGGYWWGRRGGAGMAANGAGATGANTYAGYRNGNAAGPNANGTATGTNGNMANIGEATGPGVQVLDSANKKSFVGQHFQANNLPVAHKVSDKAVWLASSTDGQPMLAVVNQNNNAMSNVNQGTRVDAAGTVEKAPPMAQAKNEFHLNDQQAKRLEQEGAYIEVSQLTVPENMGQQ